MPDVLVTDTITLNDVSVTSDGYLAANARVARAGIYQYRGVDVGMNDLATVRVYRSPEAVFDAHSVASFAHKPVTLGHPPEQVNAANWKTYAKGHAAGEVMRDGDHLRIPLLVSDGETVDIINGGVRELSAGYNAKVTRQAGITDSGEAYDAVMTDMRGNHIAVVPAGRAGATCRIGDSWEPTAKPEPTVMPTIVHDGLTIEAPQQAIEVINKLQRQIADATAASDRARAAADAAAGTATATITAKDAEIAALKAAAPNAVMLDALVAERQTVFDAAKPHLPKDYSFAGKSIADVRKDVVVTKVGDAAIVGKSADYIDAFYDAIIKTAPASGGSAARVGVDPLARVFAGHSVHDAARGQMGGGKSASEIAYEENMRRYNDSAADPDAWNRDASAAAATR